MPEGRFSNHTLHYVLLASSKTFHKLMCSHSKSYLIGIRSTESSDLEAVLFPARIPKRLCHFTLFIQVVSAASKYPLARRFPFSIALSSKKRDFSEQRREIRVVSPMTKPFLVCIRCAEDYGSNACWFIGLR